MTARRSACLREPEAVGTVDDDRVCGWHIDTAFNDGRAQQHIKSAMMEIEHDLFKVAFRHLTVGNTNTRLGDQFFQLVFYLVNVADAIVYEIHLAAALDLAQLHDGVSVQRGHGVGAIARARSGRHG